ncbi:MAG: hypothetical protein MK135_12240 [Polyangiaceae bacterium]|nr:hypothetical protein [Polyangiaceae bacterium]
MMPGQGMSAIRFGATPETVRRHMGTDCDQKSENHCLYIDKAVEFFFEEGTLNKILIHRRNHRVPNTKAPIRKFGLFYGYIPPDIRPGLHRKVVLEEFGAPTRVEKLSQPTADGTIEKHYYDGIILSYDRLGNGNIVLSALEVIPSKTAKDPYGVITKKKIEDTPLKKYLEQ